MEKHDNKKQRKKPDLKRAGRAAGRTAAGAGMAVSLLLGSLFSSPGELAENGEPPSSPPTAIVQTCETDPVYESFTDAGEPAAGEKRGLRERLRALILRMPLAVRILVLMPMWAAGYAVIWLASLLAGAISLPVVGAILKFIIGAAVVFGLILLAEKLLFPGVWMRELLSKRNLGALLLTAGVIAAAGALGGYLWKDMPWLTAATDVGAALLYVGFFLIFIKGRNTRPRRKAATNTAAEAFASRR